MWHSDDRTVEKECVMRPPHRGDLESNDFADKLAKTGSGEPCITFAGVQVHWLTISGISAFTRPRA